ncbi:hypothetical protein Taro_013374 [Colocasia esculenta]|uniref:Uncharacterized protein n=1 Tax=Colocasia esculenta TaxID=4460 RepID=A0A843UG85_COLES|nr:hypothetical protein [Colocasia esculenta]
MLPRHPPLGKHPSPFPFVVFIYSLRTPCGPLYFISFGLHAPHTHTHAYTRTTFFRGLKATTKGTRAESPLPAGQWKEEERAHAHLPATRSLYG